MNYNVLDVLLVEDNALDVVFVTKAATESLYVNELHVAGDGVDAINYLLGHLACLPNLIVTDLKMPRMNGYEFLKWLKQDSEFAAITTVVYSCSSLEADICEAYRLGASCYYVKPNTISDMAHFLASMFEFWALCAKPPPGARLMRSQPSPRAGEATARRPPGEASQGDRPRA